MAELCPDAPWRETDRGGLRSAGRGSEVIQRADGDAGRGSRADTKLGGTVTGGEALLYAGSAPYVGWLRM